MRMARARACAAAVLLLLTAPAAVGAQGWAVEASAGRTAHGPAGSVLGTTGATLSLLHEGTRWLYLSGGVPFDTAGVPWGAAGLGTRLSVARGALRAGGDLAGHAYGFRDRVGVASGGGVTVEMMPLLSITGRMARVELRSGLLHHTSAYAGRTASRSLHASDARLTVGSAAMQVAAEGRFWRAAEGDYPYAGMSVQLGSGGVGAWGFAGRWLSDRIEEPVWGAGARLRLPAGTEVHAAYQQESIDPLFWNAPRRSWTIGLSRRFGRAAPRVAVPAAPVVAGGGVTFRLPLSVSATAPSVGGDFNAWTAVPMQRQGDAWVLTLPIPTGIHQYGFRDADGEWFVPESVPGRRDDGFGGLSATLVVP